jgi:hypothetical protein
LGEWIESRDLARVPSQRDVPRAPARLHRVVDRSTPLALDRVALRVRLLDGEELFLVSD